MCSSSDTEDSFLEEFLSPKEIAIRKIEFAFIDFEDQLENGEQCPILRVSHDNSNFQIKYGRNTILKMRRDLKCLYQVYDLLINNKKSTKREMYYEFKELYEKQSTADRCIQQICELLDEPRTNLNILSCSKGLLRGSISFLSENTGIVDARVQTTLISEELLECSIINDAEFILVVEKEAIFQKLLDESYCHIFPNSIIVTGKGYPDICTRNFLRSLVNSQNIPIFGLFDADPHGIEIMLTYKYGSTSDRAEGRGAYIPSIQWIGLFPSDKYQFNISSHQFLPLSRLDHVKINTLLNRCLQLEETHIVRELDLMLQSQKKLELESISQLSTELMARALIMPRVQAYAQ